MLKFRYRDRELAKRIIDKLRQMKLNLQIMHVCGTHQDTIVKFGLDSMLREVGVKVIAGPGCPVCVTTAREFEEAVALAEAGKTVAVFGDAYRVPGITKSLAQAKARGRDVRIVYSIEDAVKLAAEDREVVFMAIGFETTAPSTAVTLLKEPPENFTVLTCHRYVPPVLKAILEMGEVRLDGLIEPGHVSTIIGVKPYEPLSERFKIPQVIAGFEPLDVLMAVYMIAKQVARGEARVENEYTRSVRYEGNTKALKVIDEVFEPVDIEWRGFPVVPGSGMKLKRGFEEYDARRRYEDELKKVQEMPYVKPKGCKCDEILRGLKEPADCPLFGRACTPQHPVGPCMVSIEGSCAIEYKYGRRRVS